MSERPSDWSFGSSSATGDGGGTLWAVLVSIVLHAFALILPLRLVFADRSTNAVDPWTGTSFAAVTGAPGAGVVSPSDSPSPLGQAAEQEVAVSTEPIPSDPAPRGAQPNPHDRTAATDPIAGDPADKGSGRAHTARPTLGDAARPHGAAHASAPGAPSANAGSTAEGPVGGGTYGAEAEGVSGVRAFGTAFAHMVSHAVSPDPSWLALGSGPAGQVDFHVSIDDSGHAVADPLDARVPAHWRSLVARTFALLSSTRFALSTTSAGGGAHVHLSAVVSHVAVDPKTSEAGGAFGLGNDPPSPGGVRRAYWSQATGQHVEITIRIVEDASRRPR